MQTNLAHVPFSTYGSYLAISLLDSSDTPGLYLRNVHGDVQKRRVFKIDLIDNGQPVPFTTQTQPHALKLQAPQGQVELCFATPQSLSFRGQGVGLRLSVVHLEEWDYATALRLEHDAWQITHFGNRMNYLLRPGTQGQLHMDAPMGVARCLHVVADFLPANDGEAFEGLIEEFRTVPPKHKAAKPFASHLKAAEKAFATWLKKMPAAPAFLKDARELAAYIDYSCVAGAEGHLKRPAMFMSKNWMTHVWSWDHCFNAMALIYHQPEEAWDQFMVMFDMQDASGQLPDSYDDCTINWNFCKPPVHGWALNWMMERSKKIDKKKLKEIYEPLSRWTRWWFQYRDSDKDGIPQYAHGNDSGWDNATVFDVGFPLEGPELSAFLVLQMDCLAKVAGILGKAAEAKQWKREADQLLQKLLKHSWRGDRFIAPRSGDHAVAEGDSLFNFMPLVLGKRLKPEQIEPLLKGLTQPGRFLTENGLATESVQSRFYRPDGYWRGPIWAPSTMLLVDAVDRLGRKDLAKDLALRYCKMAAKSGMPECYDAVTGAALRDKAYSWTSSVFLVLAKEYLM